MQGICTILRQSKSFSTAFSPSCHAVSNALKQRRGQVGNRAGCLGDLGSCISGRICWQLWCRAGSQCSCQLGQHPLQASQSLLQAPYTATARLNNNHYAHIMNCTFSDRNWSQQA